jgi:hypothetical protein
LKTATGKERNRANCKNIIKIKKQSAMKRKISILSCTLLYCQVMFSQLTWNGEMVASPNAASLGIYGDYPVSLYTGIPDINIPLYTIEVSGYRLPITLNYHASGIKVAQEASWVGLGWSLNAGGVISRTIKGYSDLDDPLIYPGYPDAGAVPESREEAIDSEYLSFPQAAKLGFPNPITGFLFSIGIVDGRTRYLIKDGEPDIFSYNFAGRAGQFVVKKRQDTGPRQFVGVPLKFNDALKIETTDILGASWSIQTPDGCIYRFDKPEKKKVFLCKFNLTGCGAKFLSEYDTTTAWYLSLIELPNKEKIEFIYAEEKNAYESLPYHHTISQRLLHKADGVGFLPGMPYQDNRTDENRITDRQTIGQRLKEIRWAKGRIVFQYSERLDMNPVEYTNDDKPQKLNNMVIYEKKSNGSEEIFRKIVFNTSYFTSENSSGDLPDNYHRRLKLDSLCFHGKTKQDHEYKFIYDISIPMPAKHASSDLWGYNSNKGNGYIYGNSAFFIEEDVYGYDYDPNRNIREKLLLEKGTYIDGKDKSCDPNAIQAGMLKKIIYPTGDYTEFTYEPNSYYEEKNSFMKWKEDSIFHILMGDTVSVGFFLHTDAKLDLSLIYSENIPQYVDLYRNHIIGKLYCDSYETDSLIGIFELTNHKRNTTVIFSGTYQLKVGHYKIKYYTGIYPGTINAISNFTEIVGAGERLGGGLRIKKIKTPFTEKEYIYMDTQNKTSGLLISPISYYRIRKDVEIGENPAFPYLFTFLVSSSSTYGPLVSSSTGVAVGYSQVNVVMKNGNQISKEENYFYNQREIAQGINMPNILNIRNGNLLSTKYYSNNLLIRKDTFQYNFSNLLNFRAVTCMEGETYNYSLKTARSQLKEKSTIYYHYNNNLLTDSLVEKENYFYHAENLLVNKLENFDSQGNKHIKTTTYVPDISGEIYTGMKSRYMIGTPIEEFTEKNGSILSAKLSTYQYTNNMYLPSQEYTLSKNTPINKNAFSRYTGGVVNASYDFPDLSFESYDSKGNFTSVLEKETNRTIYIWSYNYQYLVAKIQNATLSEIKACGVDPEVYGATLNPNMNLLNSLRQFLPQAMITTYQYSPLKGMTSQTDYQGITTFYTYDDYGRLEESYIMEGDVKKILRRHDYHFRNK